MEQVDGPGVGRHGVIILRAEENAVVAQGRYRRAEMIVYRRRGIIEGRQQDGALGECGQRCGGDKRAEQSGAIEDVAV
jgi:hypothetical protein